MFKVSDNIYIWVFLVNIETVLLLALVRYVLYSHFTQNCILLYFLQANVVLLVVLFVFCDEKLLKIFLYLCIYFVQRTAQVISQNPSNSGTVARRKPPDPSLSRIFKALLIGVQYKVSFQWTNCGLKCLQIEH